MPSLVLVGVTAYAALGGFVFGFDLGVIAGVLPSMTRDLSLDHVEAELVVGGCKMGAALGALAAVFLLRPLGHRCCFSLSGAAYVGGPVLMALADTWWLMALGRGLTGVGIGLSAVAAPAYLGEVAPPSVRGAVVGAYELLLCVGLLVAAALNFVLLDTPLQLSTPLLPGWRLPLCAPGALGACVLLGAPCLPPSPATMVRAGRYDDAFDLLVRLAGGRADGLPAAATRVSSLSRFSSTRTTPLEGSAAAAPRGARSRHVAALDEAQRLLDALLAQAERSAARAPVSVKRLVCGRERRAGLLMFCLAVVNQANGSSTLLNYISDVIGATGAPSEAAAVVSIAVAAAKLLAVAVALRLIDAVGRRPLLLAGALGSAAALGALATAISAGSLAATIAALAAFMLVYAVSLAPIFFVLLSELFSDDAKPLAAGLATALTFAAGAVVDSFFLSLVDAIGHSGALGLLAAVCLVGGAAVLWMLPETKGKSLLEVQRLMAPRRAPPAQPLRQSANASDEEEEAEADENEETRRMLVRRRSSPWILAA